MSVVLIEGLHLTIFNRGFVVDKLTTSTVGYEDYDRRSERDVNSLIYILLLTL